MTDPDSLPAELRSFEEAATEDETGADGIGDAVVVPFGQGIAVDHGGDADQSAGPAPDGSPAAATQGIDATDLPDDPMGMYLRDLSAVPLLTREGEVALAKRIEAGRRSILEGLCSSLPAMAAVSAWRDAILEGTLALRHVIDIGATYGGGRRADDGREGIDGAGDAHGGGEDDGAATPELAAMEEAIRPAVMETLDGIAAAHAMLRRLEERSASCSYGRTGR